MSEESGKIVPEPEVDVRRITVASPLQTGYKQWEEIERMMLCAWHDGFRWGRTRELRTEHRELGYPWRCNCSLTNKPHRETASGKLPHFWLDANNEAIELRRMEP